MAIFRTLKTLISQSNKITSKSRTFFSLSTTASPISITTRRHILYQSRFSPPSVGPLFLSNPPWKLSQSATPLLLQSDVVLNFLKLRALNLLHQSPYNVRYVDITTTTTKNLSNESSFISKEEIIRNEGIISSESYLNAPNLISIARMVSGPFIGWMIVNDMYTSAFVALSISGASDWLDGYVARKMRIDSVVGSYLDPLADKVLIGCVALAMVDKGLLHPGLVALVVMRDVALVGGAVYKRATDLDWKWNGWRDFVNLDGARAQKVKPLFISKVNTVFQLALVAAALLQPGFGSEETQLYIDYLSWLVASTTVASTAAYGVQHLGSGAALMRKTKFGT